MPTVETPQAFSSERNSAPSSFSRLYYASMSAIQNTVSGMPSSNVISASLVKYISVSETALLCSMQQNNSAIDCFNHFLGDFFGSLTPTLFLTTVVIEVVSNCRRFFWQAGWSA
tara:strand:- start:544 stop:885 length:342 start_codon:yes stop_codon:yes gene_type:complete